MITLGSMGGRTMVPVSAALRSAIGVEVGDQVEVGLVLDSTPRTADVPPALAAALAAEPTARVFFDALSNSLQRYHVDQVASAKTDETRQRRVDKAIALFLDGKKR